MSTTISPQTHRLMRVTEIDKERWDTVRPHALKKARDSFIYPLFWDVEADKDEPFYLVAFRHKGKYYTGTWDHMPEEFNGIEIVEGIQQITQVYYAKPHAEPQAA